MKKYLTLIMSVLLIIQGLCIPSYAAEPEFTITTSSARVTNAPQESDLIVALYNGTQLTGVKMYNGTGTINAAYSNDMKEQMKNSDNIKVFLWDMKTIKPLANSFSEKLSNLPTPAPLPEQIGNMRLINGGTYTMGSPTDEPERGSDEIQHEVNVDSFYMSKTELSQKEYQAVMGENPSENKGENLPVTNITWYDAIQYCNELSKSEGLTPCYTVSDNTVTWNKAANGYRLPTEAEWEYAARANTDTPFSFGDYVNDTDANCYNAYGYNNDASGNWINGYLQHTVNVENYNTNGNGLYNIHGNAAEWVWDWYGAYDTTSSANPTGAENGSAKIIRGGGWNDQPKHIRSAYRGAQPADVPLYSIGMRLVRNAEPMTDEIKSIYSTKAENKTGKTLIAYFSQTGNTDGLAKIIQEMSDADIFRIERKTPYSSNHNGSVLYGEALEELRNEESPDLKAYLEDEGMNIDDYDTILLGYCNWWASIPAPVHSFLTHYDLSGKTIIPFCSMGGGRFGQTISAIAKLTPNSVIKEGLEVTYSSYDRNEIREWLEKIPVSIPTPTPTPIPTPTPTPTPTPDSSNVLVAYFSCTNNTEGIAKHILNAVDADEYEIVPEVAYTSADLNYNTDCRANREQNDASARPAISGSVENMEDYDIIFLGYPIWWGQAPKIIYTFLESYDMSGKTIVPFCTSASSGVGSSATNLHSLCSDTVTWTAGRRFASSASSSSVVSWIDGLGLNIK